MSYSATKYAFVPQAGRSEGNATLAWPIGKLLRDYLDDFARHTAVSLQTSAPAPQIDALLEEARLSSDALSGDEWFSDTAIRIEKALQSASSLLKAAASAEDIASDNGSWREEIDAQLKILEEEAELAILDRLRDQITSLRRTHGNQTAYAFWTLVVRQIQTYQAELANARPVWSADDSHKLREIGASLRRAVPTGWKAKSLKYLTGDIPIPKLLGRAEMAKLQRQGRTLDDLAKKRVEQRCWHSKTAHFASLLGSSSIPGELDRLLQPILDDEKLFQAVDAQLQSTERPLGSSESGDIIWIVQSLDDVIDRSRARTVRDLFNERAERAGWTPERLAARIRENGLVVDGRPVSCDILNQYASHQIAQSLLEETTRALGDPQSAHPNPPVSAVDFIAQLTLSSNELRPRVITLNETWVARSQPRVIVNELAGVVVHQRAYLLCAAEDRPGLEALLSAEEPTPNTNGEFTTTNPYKAQLIQARLAAPVGASREHWKWRSAANAQLKTGIVAMRFDLRSVPETRYLHKRVRNRNDCKNLFNANRTTGDVYEVLAGSGRFALTRHDPRLMHYFAPVQFTPCWQSPRFFASLLQSGGPFLDLMQVAHSEIPKLRAKLSQLAKVSDPDRIAEALATFGILEVRRGQCRLIHTVSKPWAGLPAGVYDEHFGQVVGLAEDAFVAQLLDCDLLYNVLFCSALDQFELGRLTKVDVPPSVVAMSREIMSY